MSDRAPAAFTSSRQRVYNIMQHYNNVLSLRDCLELPYYTVHAGL